MKQMRMCWRCAHCQPDEEGSRHFLLKQENLCEYYHYFQDAEVWTWDWKVISGVSRNQCAILTG